MVRVIGLLMCCALVGCDGKAKSSDSVQNAEFGSLADCLAGIKRHSGGGELKIVTDKPDEVSGFLANGKGFGCEVKGTGVKGWYFE